MAKSKKEPTVKGKKPKKKPMRKLVKSKSYEKEGRPTKYNPMTHPVVAQALAQSGLIDDEISEAMMIHRTTFYEWKKKYPEFSNAVANGKSKIDIEVQNELLKNCRTREVIEEKQIMESGKPKRTERTKKHELGSVRAQQFWLKNRMRTQWLESLNVNVNDQRKTEFENMSDKELEEAAKRYGDILGEEKEI